MFLINAVAILLACLLGSGFSAGVAESRSISALISARGHHERPRHHLRALMRHAHRHSKRKMTSRVALRTLGKRLDVLPRAVLSLLNHGQKKSNLRYAPSESTVTESIGMFNEMIVSAWGHLDAKVVHCRELLEELGNRKEGVDGEIARLADALGETKGERNVAIANLQETEQEIAEVERRRAEETRLQKEKRRNYEQEIRLRGDDRDVARLLVGAVSCSGSSFLQEQHSGGVLRLHHEASAELSKKLTPHMKNLMAQAGFALKESLLQRRRGRHATSTGNETLNMTDIANTPSEPIAVELNGGKKAFSLKIGEVSCGFMKESSASLLGEAQDSVDELEDEYSRAEQAHEAMMNEFNLQMQLLVEAKREASSLLAEATSTMNSLDDEKEHSSAEIRTLREELRQRSTSCHEEISGIVYSEICSLKTVRAALAQFGSGGVDAIVDCEVSDWRSGDCSVSCDDHCTGLVDHNRCGGSQLLTRMILQSPNSRGAKCPSLTFTSRCNQVQCPKNCEMSAWGGWGSCTKQCDAGVRQRTRVVLQAPRHGGEGCEAVSETESCGTDACNSDCSLKPWTGWAGCSAACGTGYAQRFKNFLIKSKGDGGTCPSKWSNKRWDVTECNTNECNGDEVCLAKEDFVLALDTGGAMNEDNLSTLKSLAAALVRRFRSEAYGEEAARVGVVQFGNGQIQEDGATSPATEAAALSEDVEAVAGAIEGLSIQSGFPNVAQALDLAEKMFANHGQNDRGQKVVLITDSKPTFCRQSLLKARQLQEKNVQIFVVALSPPSAEKDSLKDIASWPKEANYLRIKSFGHLKEKMDDYVTRILTKACAVAESPVLMTDGDKVNGFKLLKEDTSCGSPANRKQLGWDEAMDPEMCRGMALADNEEAASFGLGKGVRHGSCYSETGDAECSSGFVSSLSDFYQIIEQTAAE